MDMTGEYRIGAPRERVWKALNDPDVLKQCIAGCEMLDKTSDTEFSARVSTRVGPVSAKFTGKVELSEIDPPNGYRISGEGQGGVAGFARGGATVKLTEDGGATLLAYEANATVGGKLAQIGSRLIDSTARKMADDFFGKFAETVGQAEEGDLRRGRGRGCGCGRGGRERRRSRTCAARRRGRRTLPGGLDRRPDRGRRHRVDRRPELIRISPARAPPR